MNVRKLWYICCCNAAEILRTGAAEARCKTLPKRSENKRLHPVFLFPGVYPTITECCFGQSNCSTCGAATPKSKVWMAICQAYPLVEKSLQVSLEGLRMIAKHFAQVPSSKIFHLHHHHTQHHPHCKNTQVNHWSWPIRASKMVAALSSEPGSRLLQRLISHKFQKKSSSSLQALSEEGCRLEFVHLTWPVKNHNSFKTHKVLKNVKNF